MALDVLMALGVLIAFDLDLVIVEIHGLEFRPHHFLACVGLAATIRVATRAVMNTDSLMWSSSQRLVLRGLFAGELGMLTAAYFSPFGSIVHQRTLDLSMVFVVAVTTVVVARRHRLAILISIGIGVGLAAIIALIEYTTASGFLIGDQYRGRLTFLGDGRRLTRPFSHANIAAMFFGPAAVAAFALGLVQRETTQNRRRSISAGPKTRTAALGAAALLVAITTLTASRAGIAAVIVGVLVLASVASKRTVVWILVGLITGVVAVLPWSPAVRDRVDSSDRFAATVEAPIDFVLDETKTISVLVSNQSSDVWPSVGPDRVLVSARWRDLDQNQEWLTQVWPIPTEIGPGALVDVSIQVPLDVPDGRYLIVWDLLLDREAFFLESAGVQALTTVDVVNSLATLDSGPVVRAPRQPTRPEIWGWTVELFQQRPVFGHGVAMMRFVVADVTDGTSVAVSHGHNIVLEPLASSGLVGSFSLIALLGLLAVDLARRVRHVDSVGLIVGSALIVMLVHGLVEWPLMFLPLSTLFAMLAGLWTVSREGVPTA
ncbi:O-antigen ligase family protein [Acidimicrobiaceae bacterium AH-315-P05]|nr:O-antigen ligase family protein [Acidimicrobiaceae bacterium AH-315-P05]